MKPKELEVPQEKYIELKILRPRHGVAYARPWHIGVFSTSNSAKKFATSQSH